MLYERTAISKKPEEVAKAEIAALRSEDRLTPDLVFRDTEGKPKEYIPVFLEREIEKPIIRWQDRPQLGYEILPNKYFYRYTPPPAGNDLLEEFWVLEKEAEGLLKGLVEDGGK